MSDRGRFHAKDGWFWSREDDGSVRLDYENGQPWRVQTVTFDADTWASIVAAVSLTGEHGETFHAAQRLHNRMPHDWALDHGG